MRRSIAAVVVALSTAFAVLPATSSSATDSGAGPAAPTVALPDQAAGEVLARATEILSGEVTGSRRSQGAESRPEATLALRDLFVALPALGSDDRLRAQGLLARPTAGPNDQYGDGYTVKARKKCRGHFCLHWVSTSADAASSGWVNKNLTLMNKVWKHEVRRLGYRAPVRDGRFGGNRKFDVYLKELGSKGLYGYCAPERFAADSKRRASGYCVLDNDFARSQYGARPTDSLRVTAAHEFFHAIQFAYDFREDRWLLENTATWMEERFADGVNDNRQYLPYGQVRQPTQALDIYDQGGFNQYGNWSFFEYLSQRYGNATVKAIWRRVGVGKGSPNQYSTAAVRSVLRKKGGFTKVFRAYAAGNTIPGRTYAEGNTWPSALVLANATLGKADRHTALTTRINHMASRNVVIKPARSLIGKRWTARITIDAPNGKTSPAAYLIIKKKHGGYVKKGVPLTSKGFGRAGFTFSTSSVRSVTITLVNASTRFTCSRGGQVYSCHGKPRDDNMSFGLKVSIVRR